MLSDHVVTGLRLNEISVPVDVVERNLHEFDFRMFRENLVQAFRIVMIGEADVTNFPLLLPLLQMLEHMTSLHFVVVADPVHIVQEEIIEVVDPAVFQLLFKDIHDLCSLL